MLTIAVTGPTGEIGRSFISALERAPEVERVIGMARRPFDLGAQGWEKTEYRRGDILDRDAVDALVADADVVVHLAFVIVAGRGESRKINLTGSRNGFEAAAAAGFCAAVIGHGEPGVYILAGPGQLTVSDLAHELGWHAVPAPQLAVGAAAEAIAPFMSFLPAEAAWIEAVRRPVLMDTSRARRKLHWMPHHDARETLRETVAAVRARH